VLHTGRHGSGDQCAHMLTHVCSSGGAMRMRRTTQSGGAMRMRQRTHAAPADAASLA
jgi:hypothetical protein